MRHRVARVDGQVQQHLIDHAGIGVHIRGAQPVDKLHRHVFADDTLQQARETGDGEHHTVELVMHLEPELKVGDDDDDT